MRIRLDRQKILRLLGGWPVQVPTEVGLLELEAEQEPWVPMRRIPMTAEIAATHDSIGMASHDLEVWTNGTYEAFLKPGEDGREGACHLSIKRMDRMATHNWRHLQQIKNEVMGELREAVELFPSEERIADTANQTHIWVMPTGVQLPFGFEHGFTFTDEQTDRFNANATPGYQEPQQPGLTTGDTMREAIAEGMASDPETKAQFERIIDHGPLA